MILQLEYGAYLTEFVESHNDDRRTKFANNFGFVDEIFFALFQRNRIDDAFSLTTFKPSFDYSKIRLVDTQTDLLEEDHEFQTLVDNRK